MNEEIYQEEVIEPIDDRAGAAEALEVELSTAITISDDELANGSEDKKPEYFETLLKRLKNWASNGKILLHYHGLYFVQIIGESTYYVANDDGTISSFAPYQFDENTIKADEEIVQGYDGKYYFASQCPEQPLEELKLIKRAEINKARNEAEQGGFTYMNKVFDSDQVSCQRISCAAQAMQMVSMSTETPTITWTCQDNTAIDLTAQELMGLVVALAEWSNSCHQKATALKAQIEACRNKEELDLIKWEESNSSDSVLSEAEEMI